MSEHDPSEVYKEYVEKPFAAYNEELLSSLGNLGERFIAFQHFCYEDQHPVETYFKRKSLARNDDERNELLLAFVTILEQQSLILQQLEEAAADKLLDFYDLRPWRELKATEALQRFALRVVIDPKDEDPLPYIVEAVKESAELVVEIAKNSLGNYVKNVHLPPFLSFHLVNPKEPEKLAQRFKHEALKWYLSEARRISIPGLKKNYHLTEELFADLLSFYEEIEFKPQEYDTKFVEALMIKVRNFGFHLASIDLDFSDVNLGIAENIRKECGSHAVKRFYFSQPSVEKLCSASRNVEGFDLIPCFSSYEEIRQAPELIAQLLSKTGRHEQHIIFGCKTLPSFWEIFKAKEAITQFGACHHIRFTFSDGTFPDDGPLIRNTFKYLRASSGNVPCEVLEVNTSFEALICSKKYLEVLFNMGLEAHLFPHLFDQLSVEDLHLIEELMDVAHRKGAGSSLAFMGFGSGLKQLLERGNHYELQRLYSHSALFRLMVSWVESSLRHPSLQVHGNQDDRVLEEARLTAEELSKLSILPNKAISERKNLQNQIFIPALVIEQYLASFNAEEAST